LAYCTARFRRSNFGHQMPPRLSMRSALQRRNLELMGGNKDRQFCLDADFHGISRDLLHAANLAIGFTFLPKEGLLRIFRPLKIRRLRPGLNPRTWVPEASTLTPRPPKPPFRAVTQRLVVDPYRRFGTTYRSRLQGPRKAYR
jgi:hypothetical protein